MAPATTTLWSRLSYQARTTIIVLSVFTGLAVTGAVLAIVLTRSSGQPVPTPTPVPTPSPSAVAPTVRQILLKNGSGDCFSFPSFNPSLGDASTCGTGTWTQDETNEVLSFDATNYEWCIERPAGSGASVVGTVGDGCLDVQLTADNAIQSQDAGGNVFCINIVSGDVTWDDCASKFTFTVEVV